MPTASESSILATLQYAKTTPPDLPRRLLRRERLLKRLEQGPRLTIVSGGAGVGKSTLLASFCREHPEEVAWYTVDELDDSAATLLDGIALSLGASVPHATDLRAHVAMIAATLQAGQQRFLFLDDIHRFGSDAIDALFPLIRYSPTNVRL